METLKTIFGRIFAYAIMLFVFFFISGIWNYDDKLEAKVYKIVSEELDSLYITLHNDKETNKCVNYNYNFISYTISHNKSVGRYSERHFNYYEIEFELKCDAGKHFNGYTRKEIYKTFFETHYVYTKRINKRDVKLTLFDILFLD